jgi:hypothetical protein
MTAKGESFGKAMHGVLGAASAWGFGREPGTFRKKPSLRPKVTSNGIVRPNFERTFIDNDDRIYWLMRAGNSKECPDLTI